MNSCQCENSACDHSGKCGRTPDRKVRTHYGTFNMCETCAFRMPHEFLTAFSSRDFSAGIGPKGKNGVSRNGIVGRRGNSEPMPCGHAKRFTVAGKCIACEKSGPALEAL